MSAPKTTWEDLARLGWPKYDVYKRANAERGGSMNSERDLHLNSGVAATYQWWSYNVTIGQPYILGSVPNFISRNETAWQYDNSKNSQPFKDSWSESWSNTRSATLSVTTGVAITLNYSITIFNVASSGFDLSISTESTSTESKEERYELQHTWDIEVGPYEKISLIRTIATASEVTQYGQDFGLSGDSMVGTEGNKWNGHYYWGMYLNPLLGSPRGRLDLQGSSRSVTYSFTLVREGPNGTQRSPLPVDLEGDVTKGSKKPSPDVLKKWTDQAKRAVGDGPAAFVVPGEK